jgi:hypothetical protein
MSKCPLPNCPLKPCPLDKPAEQPRAYRCKLCQSRMSQYAPCPHGEQPPEVRKVRTVMVGKVEFDTDCPEVPFRPAMPFAALTEYEKACEDMMAEVPAPGEVATRVTDPDLDAPDGAVVDGRKRVGDRWEPVRPPKELWLTDSHEGWRESEADDPTAVRYVRAKEGGR